MASGGSHTILGPLALNLVKTSCDRVFSEIFFLFCAVSKNGVKCCKSVYCGEFASDKAS